MRSYFPLHVHSHYSLLDGLSKPKDIAKRCQALNLAGSAVTDHGNISVAVGFINAMKQRKLKPIISRVKLYPEYAVLQCGKWDSPEGGCWGCRCGDDCSWTGCGGGINNS